MFNKVSIVPVLFVAMAIALGGCKKVEDTKAVITVVDAAGVVVPDAYVKLYADPIPPLYSDFSRLTMEGSTNIAGQVTFDYTDFYKQGQAGFAVLDILAMKDTLVGEGIIRITEEETNSETVTLVTAD